MADIGSLEFELNRLAHRVASGLQMVGAATAANEIAGTSGLQVVGALNTFLGIPQPQWLGLDGACQLMARTYGTRFTWSATTAGVGAAHALSMIESLGPPMVSDYLDAYTDAYGRAL